MSEQLLTTEEAEVLLHTSRTGRYVTDDSDVIKMAERGLLFDHGAQPLAGGAHYFVMTGTGRKALNAWQEARPKPPKPKRNRSSEAFRSWRRYLDATYSRVTFKEYLDCRREGRLIP